MCEFYKKKWLDALRGSSQAHGLCGKGDGRQLTSGYSLGTVTACRRAIRPDKICNAMRAKKGCIQSSRDPINVMLENFGHFGEVIKVQKLFTSTLLSKLGSNGDTYFLQSQPSKDGKTPKMQKGNFLKLGKPSCYEGIYQPKKNWYFSTRCIFAKCTQLRHLLSFIYNDKRYNMPSVYSFLCSRQLHGGDLLLTVFAPQDFPNCAHHQECLLRRLYPMPASNTNNAILYFVRARVG